MSYVTGTASNHLDLLDKLRVFLTATLPADQRWTVNDFGLDLARMTIANASSNPTIAARLFNGAGTWNTSGTPAGQWVSMTYDEPVHITRIRITSAALTNNQPSGFSLQCSDDGVTWSAPAPAQSVAGLTLASWSAGMYEADFGAVAPSNKHKHWRLVFSGVTTGSAISLAGVQLWEGTVDITTQKRARLLVKGPGSGTGQPHVTIATEIDSINDTYNWLLDGSTGYTAGAGVYGQPGSMGRYLGDKSPALLLWNQPIKYWFIGNGRRFIVIAKVNTTYHAMYAGFCLPYANPILYPYPMIIGGSSGVPTARWSGTNRLARNFYDAVFESTSDSTTISSLMVRSPGGETLRFANWAGSPGSEARVSATSTIYPPKNLSVPYGASFWEKVRESWGGKYTLSEIVLSSSTTPKLIVGELDGVSAVAGHQVGAENIIQDGGDDYLLIPNVYRSDRHQWAAFKLS